MEPSVFPCSVMFGFASSLTDLGVTAVETGDRAGFCLASQQRREAIRLCRSATPALQLASLQEGNHSPPFSLSAARVVQASRTPSHGGCQLTSPNSKRPTLVRRNGDIRLGSKFRQYILSVSRVLQPGPDISRERFADRDALSGL